MKQLKKLLVIGGVSLLSALPVHAAIDAKSYGRGGAGVSASNYIYAPLYNPALVANYDTYEKRGIAIPSYMKVIDDPDLLQSANNEMAYADQSLYMAYAMPDSQLTQSFYVHAREYKTQTVSLSAAIANKISSTTNINEFGYALAWFTPLRYNTTFYTGLNIKIQQVETSLSNVAYSSSTITNSVSDLLSASGDTDVNFDFGIAFRIQNVTLGATMKNLLDNQYESNLSNGSRATYEIAPQTTLSATLDYTDMRFTLDYDLNKADRITQVSGANISESLDDVQYLKFGFEYYFYHDYTARLGFINDMAGERSAQLTLGLGVDLSKRMTLDTGLSYFGTSKYGAGFGLQVAY